MHILLIEDDAAIVRAIRRGLMQARYTVDVAIDGLCGLDKALEGDYSLLILDLMLPSMDGLRICEELRSRRRRIPILMLTARGSVSDKVRGLETGADDYLPKPFDVAELLARVQALLRRERMHKARIVNIEDLKLDTGRRQVWRGEQEILLSYREYQLLEALATHEGQTLTRDEIQERVWMNDTSFSNTVDVCIGVLRKKVDSGRFVKLIHTVRGLGYVLRPPDHAITEAKV